MPILGGGLIVDPMALGGVPAPVFITFGANAISSTTATRYLFPFYDETLAPLASGIVQFIIPIACTLDRMYVTQNSPAGNGNSSVYTVRKNSIPTALSLAIPSTSFSAFNIVNSVSFLAGDIIDVEVTKAASIGSTPVNICLSLRVTA